MIIMPAWFETYLESLTKEQADELHQYFDGGDCIEEIVDIIAPLTRQ